MREVRSYVRSLERSERARTRPDRPRVFTMRGRIWDLLDEVFAPNYSPSTSVSLEFLGSFDDVELPRSGSLLEIGSGTGIVAVTAALMGCDRVLASDINPQAVRNTELNARRHGVSGRVRSVHSDLFAALPPHERFDTVFWHSNYVLAPPGFRYRAPQECAYVDPGYEAHRRFLAEAPRWTTPYGAALLHFSSRGDLDTLRRLADETGRRLVQRSRRVIRDGDDRVEHLLFQVVAD
ncbi:50S ribosomal protein L11 methyltransferase [Streptomyces sp. JJ36]|uniref:50S ribosomal protein L11 methyltransferase n=1 Tax=Streptomyces sp. JJ36 TaxID=2736645 RepID=UPI001F43E6C5|nr:class I SAM-dependent methyltransferase [Streptomyces sp. JJ36]MCF6524126.1 class I SAM-dependent methyltransferase [Streptomyces sp. JJ36]